MGHRIGAGQGGGERDVIGHGQRPGGRGGLRRPESWPAGTAGGEQWSRVLRADPLERRWREWRRVGRGG